VGENREEEQPGIPNGKKNVAVVESNRVRSQNELAGRTCQLGWKLNVASVEVFVGVAPLTASNGRMFSNLLGSC